MKSIHTVEHKKIAKLCRKTRLELNLSQQKVAKDLGISQSYLSKIESGQVRFDISIISTLAKYYKQPVSYFIK